MVYKYVAWVALFVCAGPSLWAQSPKRLSRSEKIDAIQTYFNRQQRALTDLKRDIAEKKETDQTLLNQIETYPASLSVAVQSYLSFFSLNHFRDQKLIQLTREATHALLPPTLALSDGEKFVRGGSYMFKSNYIAGTSPRYVAFDLQKQIMGSYNGSAGTRYFINAYYEYNSLEQNYVRMNLRLWYDSGAFSEHRIIDLTQRLETLTAELGAKLKDTPELRIRLVDFFSYIKNDGPSTIWALNSNYARYWPTSLEIPDYLLGTSRKKLVQDWIKSGFDRVFKRKFLAAGAVVTIGGALYYWLNPNLQETPVAQLIQHIHRECIDSTFSLISQSCVGNVLEAYDAENSANAIEAFYQFVK